MKFTLRSGAPLMPSCFRLCQDTHPSTRPRATNPLGQLQAAASGTHLELSAKVDFAEVAPPLGLSTASFLRAPIEAHPFIEPALEQVRQSPNRMRKNPKKRHSVGPLSSRGHRRRQTGIAAPGAWGTGLTSSPTWQDPNLQVNLELDLELEPFPPKVPTSQKALTRLLQQLILICAKAASIEQPSSWKRKRTLSMRRS